MPRHLAWIWQSHRHRHLNQRMQAVNLNEGDELIGVDLTSGQDEVMLFSAAGKVVRFKEDAVRAMGRTATGVRGIKLAIS